MSFAAAYDADGKLVTQKLPGQVTQTTAYDQAGEPKSLLYSGTVQPVKQSVDANGDPIEDENGPEYEPDGPALTDQPWLAWSVVNDAQGRVRSEATGPSAGFDGNPGVTNPDDITPFDTGHAIAYDRSYSYDAAGRLASVADHTADGHGADLEASPSMPGPSPCRTPHCWNSTHGLDRILSRSSRASRSSWCVTRWPSRRTTHWWTWPNGGTARPARA